MTYDPVDANDDGIVESDVDNESVSTEKESITSDVIRAYFGNNDTYVDYELDSYSGDQAQAVNQALADGARSIRLASGGHEWGETVTITNNETSIYSPAENTSVVEQTNDVAIDIEVNDSVEITGIKFTTDIQRASAITITGGAGIKNCNISHNKFVGSYSGPVIDGSFDTDLFSSEINSNCFNADAAFYIDLQSGGGNTVAIKHNFFNGITDTGIKIEGSASEITNNNFSGSQTNPSRGIVIAGSAEGLSIENNNFENFTDSNGDRVGTAIYAFSGWKNITVKNNRFWVVAFGLVLNGDGQGVDTSHVDHINNDPKDVFTELDFQDNSNGTVNMSPYRPNQIARDANNYVTGKTVEGQPVVRADDGSEKYLISVDGTGSISTSSI